VPYAHQLRAFEQLSTHHGEPVNTLVTTGSGKTECFDIVAMALELAAAVKAGDSAAAELAGRFALAVGHGLEPVNRLIAAVLAGGPFTIRRALELAELVLDGHGVNGLGQSPAAQGVPGGEADPDVGRGCPRAGRTASWLADTWSHAVGQLSSSAAR